MANERTPHIVPDVLDTGEDVTRETDRSLILRAVNGMLAFRREYDTDKAALIAEFAKMGRRLLSLELGPMRAPTDSVSDLLAATGEVLSHRARDPRDKMDSDRAKAIAREVYEASKNAEDAASLKAWRGRRWGVALEVFKVVIAAAVGAIVAHYGLR